MQGRLNERNSRKRSCMGERSREGGLTRGRSRNLNIDILSHYSCPYYDLSKPLVPATAPIKVATSIR